VAGTFIGAYGKFRDLPDLVSFLAAAIDCRNGEALATTWSHIDLDPGQDDTFTVAASCDGDARS
jgi:hypothetical protein